MVGCLPAIGTAKKPKVGRCRRAARRPIKRKPRGSIRCEQTTPGRLPSPS